MASIAAIALALISVSQIALPDEQCTPQITEIHAAICSDAGTKSTTDDSCVIHVRGQCLSKYDHPTTDSSDYRVLVADNDGFTVAEWFAPTAVGVTDLHFKLSAATIQCGGIASQSPSLSVEARLVKLQRRLGSKWKDVEEKFVPFAVQNATICAVQ